MCLSRRPTGLSVAFVRAFLAARGCPWTVTRTNSILGGGIAIAPTAPTAPTVTSAGLNIYYDYYACRVPTLYIGNQARETGEHSIYIRETIYLYIN